MSSAREGILASIVQATGSNSESRESEYAELPRHYRRTGAASAADNLAQLENRLRDYDAGVYHCNPHDIAATVAAAMRARSKTGLLRPEHLPADWLPAGFRFTPVDGMPYHEIDGAPGVITSCVVAVAFTGTIILRHGIGDGRRALTLIPDYHLCIVLANQIVETVPEGFDRLRGLEHLPLTTVSGPSATADIEMSRVKGVHGPRFLDVILVS